MGWNGTRLDGRAPGGRAPGERAACQPPALLPCRSVGQTSGCRRSVTADSRCTSRWGPVADVWRLISPAALSPDFGAANRKFAAICIRFMSCGWRAAELIPPPAGACLIVWRMLLYSAFFRLPSRTRTERPIPACTNKKQTNTPIRNSPPGGIQWPSVVVHSHVCELVP